MATRTISLSGANLSIADVKAFYVDTRAALCSYYDGAAVAAPVRFATYTTAELAAERETRLAELDRQCTLALLASVEARFRIDYHLRRQRRYKDALSRTLRAVWRGKEHRANLVDDLLTAWQDHHAACKARIGDLKDALDYRNWLAHGRYWRANLGRAQGYYPFEVVLGIAEDLLGALPLVEA